MNISLINLNDAVYRMLNPKFAWLDYFNKDSFNKTKCPLLHNHDPREVVTYKDWVTMLAGNPNVVDTASDYYSRCLARNDGANTNNAWALKPWGKTFGAYKGRGGLVPLAEVKPLDEMFWYYDALNRRFKYYDFGNNQNACRVCHWYYSNGWQWRWSETGVLVEVGDAYSWTLQPGVYGAATFTYANADAGFDIIDNSGPTKGRFPLIRTYRRDNNWRSQNAIFFVDSPVTLKIWWQGTSYHYMFGILFRFTPPGYWE